MVSLAVLLLITACQNPVAKANGERPTSNVIIKIAGSQGRTVLPSKPLVSKYVLKLEKRANVETGEEAEIISPNTTGIDGAGITVSLSAGTWIIQLDAYQDIVSVGEVLAAKGYKEIEIQNGDPRSRTEEITLNPLAIGSEYDEPGTLTYTITLPESLDTAILSLKKFDGNAVPGYEAYGSYNLITGNRSASINLSPGYYDLSVIITRNGQSAGEFESVHIYSGLKSIITLDLSYISFADKVYIMGTLGGVRLGTVKITEDSAGLIEIKSLDLDSSPAQRSANWITNIPASYIGQPIYAVQEFNDGTTTLRNVVTVSEALPANGVPDTPPLSIIPATPAFYDVAPWYAELNTSGGDNPQLAADRNLGDYWQSARDGEGKAWLNMDFGFNVSVNAARLIFNDELEAGYTLSYWNGSAWTTVISRGSASVSNNDFFTQSVTAQKFRWELTGLTGPAPALVEFGLYQVAGYVFRGQLSAAIADAQENNNNTEQSEDGIGVSGEWVVPAVKQAYQNAINAAKTVYGALLSTNQAITEAINALASATETFNAAKKLSGIITVRFSGVPRDEAITLNANQTLSWSEEDTLHITVEESFTSYQWYVDGKIRNGETGTSFNLQAHDFSPNSKHTVTLKVYKGSVPYTKSLTFTVVY